MFRKADLVKIVHYPDPILLQKAQPIERINEDIQRVAQEMIKTMHEGNGVGLAGPQVGLSQQIIVINPTCEAGKDEVFINPVILKRKGREPGEEGCLSLPGLYACVVRAEWIQVSAILLTGEKVTFVAEGFRARVLQHEIDHLNGILFTSKVQPAEEVKVKHKLLDMQNKRLAKV